MVLARTASFPLGGLSDDILRCASLRNLKAKGLTDIDLLANKGSNETLGIRLLTGKGIEDEDEIALATPESRFTPLDIQIVEDYHNLKEEQQKRLMAYMEALKKIESLEEM